jgi:hypothetical protein
VTLSISRGNNQESEKPTSEFEYRLFSPSKHRYEMPNIWQLVAGNLAANGDVHPEIAMKAAKDSEFDFHESTNVVSIIHESGRLAGTFSMTLDSELGMPVSKHFDGDLAFLRKRYRLMNGWRFSMSPLFQSSILRQRTMALFKQFVLMNEADAFVIYYNKRLEGYYRRLFTGRVVASKSISFDGKNDLPVNMMICETSENPPDLKFIHAGDFYDYAMVN